MVRADAPRPPLPPGARIAVIGSGVSGLTAAHFLSRAGYDVEIIDVAATVGMDDHSIDVGTYRVDIPVRAVSPHYYTNLFRLYAYLNLSVTPVNYSFSISLEGEAAPFLQYWYLFGWIPVFPLRVGLSPRVWCVAFDAIRYGLTTPALLRRGALRDISLEVDLRRRGFSPAFLELLLLPILSTTLSCPFQVVRTYPAENIANYLLGGTTISFSRWRRVATGIKSVVTALVAGIPPAQIKTATEVTAVETLPDGSVEVRLASCGAASRYNAVVLALEAPTALRLLGKTATPEERAALSTFCVCKSTILVHRDTSVLPMPAVGCSAACLTVPKGPITETTAAVCTILVHKLLSMPSDAMCLQTWNTTPPVEVAEGLRFAPTPAVFTRSTVSVESERVVRDQMGGIQGTRGVWFCGSYASVGGVTLLEQAVTSALDVVEDLGVTVPFVVHRGGARPGVPLAVLSEALYYRWRVAVPLVLLGAAWVGVRRFKK